METLPVSVHARDLSGGKPLAEAIRDRAVASSGTTLTESLPAALFAAEPEPGTRSCGPQLRVDIVRESGL